MTTLTWRIALREMYALSNYGFVVSKEEKTYSELLLVKFRIGAEEKLNEIPSIQIYNLFRSNKCVYCGCNISNIKHTDGDHIVAQLKPMGIHFFNVPCCESCNSLKNETSMLLFWQKTRLLVSIPISLMLIYLSAEWYYQKATGNLESNIPNWFELCLKEFQKEVIINYQTVLFSDQEYPKHIQNTFTHTKTSPNEWLSIKPDGFDISHGGTDIPLYYNSDLTKYKIIRPFYEMNPAFVFDLDECGKPTHCQLCGHPIKYQWLIKHEREKLIMEIGSECIQNYFNLIVKDEIKKHAIQYVYDRFTKFRLWLINYWVPINYKNYTHHHKFQQLYEKIRKVDAKYSIIKIRNVVKEIDGLALDLPLNIKSELLEIIKIGEK